MAETVPPQKAPPQPAPPSAEPRAAGGEGQGGPSNAALRGLLEPSGDFVIDMAGGVRLAADWLAGEGKEIPVPLDKVATAVPGLKLREAVYRPESRNKGKRLTLKATVAIPHVEAKAFEFNVSASGKPAFKLKGLKTKLGAIESPKLDIALDEEKNLSASVKVGPKNLTPKGFRNSQLKVEAEGEFTLNDGKLSGAVGASLDYPKLGAGRADLMFSEAGVLSGAGYMELSAPFAKGVRAEMSVSEEGDLIGEVRVRAAEIKHPVPGLQLTAGEVFLRYDNGLPSGGLEGLALTYPGLGSAVVTAGIEKGAFSGKGDFDVSVAQLTEVKGNWAFKGGALTGSVTVSSKDLPEALPIESGSITATLGDTGAVSFKGEVGVTLGPAGSGQLRAAYSENGEVLIGATIDLTVPGLTGARFTVDYMNGALEGEGDIPIDVAVLPGITGDVHVEYREGRWAGETELSYEADNGKLSGTIRVTVAQTEEGTLQVGGGGEVTAQLMPSLQGTLTATILPEGGVDVSGAIEVTDPIPLFDEKRFDKELFKYSQNIPLWAILVAVIRVRAGVRAGIGPGVFRDIKVEGSYTIGQEGEPSFAISGEMFIPAFVEGYVAFGAGLGLDVVLGSLTGGIEGVATAGIYGAISVIPELAYESGDYKIEGTATMAAGARLKIGLNAWAEVEALWVTVWENEWELAEWVWNVGPDLALQAKMAYVFGKPEAPTLDFSTSDIDTESLIQDAMPKDGPAPSGAKETLKNKAEWKGALKKPKPPPPLPAELSQQATKKETPPAPKKKPPKKPGPDKAAAKKAADKEGAAKPDGQKAAGAAAPGDGGSDQTVDARNAPPAKGARYPGPITLKTLEEPPAPMPRTMEQKKQDTEAASKAVDAVAKDVTDTDALDNWFPQIKRRFGLQSIAYEGDFDKGFYVRLEINPVEKPRPRVTLTGRIGKKHKTEDPKLTAGSIALPGGGSEGVGVKMVADPLGPDHGLGTSANDRLQTDLFGYLPTSPTDSGGDARRKFVRGHLLSQRFGGSGDEPKNLFPITAHANTQHFTAMEAHVREWVNVKRHWVAYTVEIKNATPLQDVAGHASMKSIDADIVTHATVLDTGLDPVSGKSRDATIKSVYRPRKAAGQTEDQAKAAHDEASKPVVGAGSIDKTTELGFEARAADKAIPQAQIEAERSPRAEDEKRLGPVLAGAYLDLMALLDSGVPGFSAKDAWSYIRFRIADKVDSIGETKLQLWKRVGFDVRGSATEVVNDSFVNSAEKRLFEEMLSKANEIQRCVNTLKREVTALKDFLALSADEMREDKKWSSLADGFNDIKNRRDIFMKKAVELVVAKVKGADKIPEIKQAFGRAYHGKSGSVLMTSIGSGRNLGQGPIAPDSGS